MLSQVEREGVRRLVLIGGPYKSGTSMLCSLIEARGYDNPAKVTNASEYAHGISVENYLTRECAIAREFNRQIVTANESGMESLRGRISGYLAEMFREVGSNLVVKDPYMKLTAVHWCRAAQQSGASEIYLFTTLRERGAIIRSWKKSRFLSRQIGIRTPEFRSLLMPLNYEAVSHLRQLRVRAKTLHYDLIERNYRANDCYP